MEARTTTEALTIDELAGRVDMTVRNLREWHTLGLLPAAEMRGRVGYYAPSVVDRIARIKELRAEGFTLELIAKMLDIGGDEVIRLAATLRGPFGGPPRGADVVPTERRIAEINASLEELGLSADQIRSATDKIRPLVERVAEIFEQVWRETIWEPFVEAGKPDEELPRIQATAARVKPLTLDALVALFTIAMDAQIERGIARELERGS
jgi:DNA-binding transcriptional MerR regulator